MAEERFSDLGRVEAIAKLYEGTPYSTAVYSICEIFLTIFVRLT